MRFLTRWSTLLWAGILTNLPRLAVGLLAVDGLHTGPLEGVLVGLSALGAAGVLTLGNVKLAHAAADPQRSGERRFFAVLAWLALLALTAVILAPLLALAALRHELATIMPQPAVWAWCIAAVVAGEVIVGAATMAHADEPPQDAASAAEDAPHAPQGAAATTATPPTFADWLAAQPHGVTPREVAAYLGKSDDTARRRLTALGYAPNGDGRWHAPH